MDGNRNFGWRIACVALGVLGITAGVLSHDPSVVAASAGHRPTPPPTLIGPLAASASPTGSVAASAAATGPQARPDARNTAAGPAGALTYYGGPVIEDPHVVQVDWGAGTYLHQVTDTGAGSLAGYYRNLPASYLGIAKEYSVPGQTFTGALHFDGAVTISPSTTARTISDTQLGTELLRQIAAGHLPAPVMRAGKVETIYSVHLPFELTVCLGANDCSRNPSTFCAYHSGIAGASGTPTVIYTVIPDYSVGAPCVDSAANQASEFETAVSHELFETMTDPYVGFSTDLAPPLGWYDARQIGGSEVGEIADICDPAGDTITGADGGQYTIASVWSNVGGVCTTAQIGSTPSPTPTTPAPTPAPAPAVNAAASALDTSVAPARLLDTRSGSPVGAGTTTQVPTGLPGATAAVVSVTSANAEADGYLTVWNSAGAPPDVSAVNFAARSVGSSLATVALDASGRFCVFSSARSDLVVDLMTGYRPAGGSVATGRFNATTPTRALDTHATRAPFGRSETRTIDLRAAGVPATASAVALNLTVTDAAGAGFWSAWPAGLPWNGTSNVNLARAGETKASGVIVGVTDGRIQVLSEVGGHLLVDVDGWYTGTSATPGTTGLFVATVPQRVLDTRTGAPFGAGEQRSGVAVGNGPTSTLPSAIVGTVTAVGNAGPGYLTVWPAGPLPTASNVNPGQRGQVLPNHVQVGVAAGSRSPDLSTTTWVLDLFSSVGTDVLFDVSGYFT